MPFRTTHENAAGWVQRAPAVGMETAAAAASLKVRFELLEENNVWLSTEKQKLAGEYNYLHRQVNELLAE